MSEDEDPRVTELFRSSRRWERGYAIFTTAVAVLAAVGYVVFMAVREARIWR